MWKFITWSFGYIEKFTYLWYASTKRAGDDVKFLLAEDEVSMSEAIVDILTYHNYQVDAVYDGADALAYAQVEQKP